MMRLDYLLLDTPRLRYRVCYRKCQVTLIWTSNKNHKVGAHIEVYHLTPELHMIQCKRVHGSILAHHELYKKLRDEFKHSAATMPIAEVRERLQEWDREHPAAFAAMMRHSQDQVVGTSTAGDGAATPSNRGRRARDNGEDDDGEGDSDDDSETSGTSMQSSASLASVGSLVSTVPLSAFNSGNNNNNNPSSSGGSGASVGVVSGRPRVPAQAQSQSQGPAQ